MMNESQRYFVNGFSIILMEFCVIANVLFLTKIAQCIKTILRFMNILTRGLVAGLGAGGFAFLASFLLERFIPDLFTQPSSPHTTEPMDATSGSNVNITLDDLPSADTCIDCKIISESLRNVFLDLLVG